MNPAPRLTLISHPTCPYVQRSAVMLKEKGVDFAVTYIDLANKPAWFAALAPLGQVPVLQVERAGQPVASVFESLVILEYIEETAAGPRFHPDQALQRAQHRAWMSYGNGFQTDLYRYAAAADAAALAAVTQALQARFAQLEKVVAGPLFAGVEFSCVDAVYAPAFHQLDLLESTSGQVDFAACARVTAWRRALAARRSVIDAVPAAFAARYVGRTRTAGSWLLNRPAV